MISQSDEGYLEFVNRRVDGLESAVAEALSKFERSEDPRAILRELFVDAGFLEGSTLRPGEDLELGRMMYYLRPQQRVHVWIGPDREGPFLGAVIGRSTRAQGPVLVQLDFGRILYSEFTDYAYSYCR